MSKKLAEGSSALVVDLLECRYPQFDGLNLCFETREGILKHCSASDAQALEVMEPAGVGRRFLDRTQPSLESQLANLADEMAYNAHDIDDGVRSGLITMEQIELIPMVMRHRDAAVRAHPQLSRSPDRRLLFETIRRMLSEQVQDVISASGAALGRERPANADQVRQMPRLIEFSASMRQDSVVLKQFLFQQLYRHPHVVRTTESACVVVRQLFDAYVSTPAEMPADYNARQDRYRAVADYIAGMTDRFAAREFQRLTGADAFAEPALATLDCSA